MREIEWKEDFEIGAFRLHLDGEPVQVAITKELIEDMHENRIKVDAEDIYRQVIQLIERQNLEKAEVKKAENDLRELIRNYRRD